MTYLPLCDNLWDPSIQVLCEIYHRHPTALYNLLDQDVGLWNIIFTYLHISSPSFNHDLLAEPQKVNSFSFFDSPVAFPLGKSTSSAGIDPRCIQPAKTPRTPATVHWARPKRNGCGTGLLDQQWIHLILVKFDGPLNTKENESLRIRSEFRANLQNHPNM